MKAKVEKLSPAELKSYIERGIITVMQAKPIPTRIQDTPEFKKYERLADQAIHLSEACRKYDVRLSTMSRWVERGLIKKLPKQKNRIMLDEQYVAYAAEVLKSNPKSRGRWLFDTNGLPYIRTTTRADRQ